MNNGYNFFPVGYPQYPYPQYNPMPQYPQQSNTQYVPSQQQSTPPQYHPITWVDNEQAVKDLKLAPGTSGEFWDKSKDVIYIKSCDTAGRESIEYYDVKEQVKTPVGNPDLKNFVSKNDFIILADEVTKLKKLIESEKRDNYNEHALRENAIEPGIRIEDRPI